MLSDVTTHSRIDIRQLCLKAGDTELLQALSFQIPSGQLTALVGPSGAGKSLTAKACLGLNSIRPGVVDGCIQIHHGADTLQLYGEIPRGVRRSFLKQIRGPMIGLLPQDPVAALDPMLTIQRQLRNVIRLTQRQGTKREVLDALSQAGFEDPARIARHYPHELSGGMAQRVCIAQALARQSKFLIADEPVTGLDPGIAQGILGRIRDLANQGVGVMVITHDLRMVRNIADRVLVIHRGRIVEELRPDQLFSARHPVTQSLVHATAKVAGGWR